MKYILIERPDISLLKKQHEIIQKIINPESEPENQDGDYISPDELAELEGLLNFIENVTDIAEGNIAALNTIEQSKIGEKIATIFDLNQNEKQRFDTYGQGDFTELGLYRLCKRMVMGEL